MPHADVHEFLLDPAGIDYVSERVDAFLNTSSLDRRSTTAARLTMENVLIDMGELVGEQAAATLRQRTFLGRPVLTLSVEGPRYDTSELNGGSDWQSSLINSSGVRVLSAYRGGRNVVMLVCPRPPLSSLMQMLAAALLGVVVAALGMLLPDQMRGLLLDSVVSPLFDTSIGLLSGLAGPTVFVSMVWGICGIGDVAALGRSGRLLVGSIMLTNLGVIPLAIASSLLCIPLTNGTSSTGSDFVDNIMQMLLGLVPTNIVKPFSEGNTLQIIVLSVILGVGILTLGDSGRTLQRIVKEFNNLFILLMEGLCRFIPVLVFLMVVIQVWSGAFAKLLTSWFPLVVIVGVALGYALLEMLYLSIKFKMSFVEIFKTCLPASTVALTTASSSASFGSMMSVCEDGFGVDRQVTSFGVPLGIVICKPAVITTFLVLMIFCAKTYGVGVDSSWFVRLALSAFFYGVAVPPVPGGMLACYTMLFNDLGIPTAALALVTAIDVMADYFSTSSDMTSVVLNVLYAGRSLERRETGRDRRAA